MRRIIGEKSEGLVEVGVDFFFQGLFNLIPVKRGGQVGIGVGVGVGKIGEGFEEVEGLVFDAFKFFRKGGKKLRQGAVFKDGIEIDKIFFGAAGRNSGELHAGDIQNRGQGSIFESGGGFQQRIAVFQKTDLDSGKHQIQGAGSLLNDLRIEFFQSLKKQIPLGKAGGEKVQVNRFAVAELESQGGAAGQVETEFIGNGCDMG